jgi:hypothetical protein
MSTVAELIKSVKALQAKAEKAAEEHYVKIGKALAELKERKPKTITWPDFVKKHFRYSKTRADELIRIAGGTVSLEEVRAGKKDRMKKSRATNPTPRGVGSKSKQEEDNVIRPSFKPATKPKPQQGDCNYDDGDPEHVALDTPQMTRRQIFLNMAREWGIKRPTEVLDDAFFGVASPEEATDDLFVEIEQVIAAWNAISDKLKLLQGATYGKKVKA